MIYDYLFYKSYQLAKKSKNFEDTPVLGGIWGVMLGFMFNVFTVLLVIDGALGSSLSANRIFTIGKYVFAGLWVLTMFLYFKHKGRWTKIVTKYEMKEKETGKSVHPIIILLAYYVISFALGTLASMYKTGDLF